MNWKNTILARLSKSNCRPYSSCLHFLSCLFQLGRPPKTSRCYCGVRTDILKPNPAAEKDQANLDLGRKVSYRYICTSETPKGKHTNTHTHTDPHTDTHTRTHRHKGTYSIRTHAFSGRWSFLSILKVAGIQDSFNSNFVFNALASG